MWNKDGILSLIDPAISDPAFEADILRCIQVGLLSVQEFPEDRPSITMVISMIESEVTYLPHPTQPGFTQRRVPLWNEAEQYPLWNEAEQYGNGRYHSVNGVSISSLGGR